MITPMDICHSTGLAPQMISKIAPLFSSTEILDAKKNYLPTLSNPDNWITGVNNLIHQLGKDPDGSKLLAVMILCMMDTQTNYKAKGIDLTIFTETMKYCAEYINAYHTGYGTYVFEQRRAKWFPRQLSLHEFRINTLEFEMCIEDTEKRIYIHIPPETDLGKAALRASYLQAKTFFTEYFPEYADANMYCDSWLLSPTLSKLLPANSRIITFQNAFAIDHTDYETNAFMDWVFKRNDLPLEDLPENTSLQRNMKIYLLQGGKVGWSHGKLKKNPWI